MALSIEDRFAIQDLLFQYARSVDQRDANAFADCFAGGQVWITGPGFEVRDAQQNIDTMSTMFEWTMHKVHNHEFTINGDSARGYTYCVATHIEAAAERRTKVDWHIRYEDELAREGERWVFTRRHLNVGLIETMPLPL